VNINIRLETPKDHYEVENLTREAFWKTIWGTKLEEISMVMNEHGIKWGESKK